MPRPDTSFLPVGALVTALSSRRTWLLAAATVLLALPTVVPSAPALSAPATGPLGVSVDSTTTLGLYYHANLSVTATPPSGSTPTGESVGADYSLQAPGLSAGTQATVRIPSAVVEIWTSGGPVHVYFSALNVTVVGASAVTGALGPSARFSAPLAFNATPGALLSTEGLAVMASWSSGASPVAFRWQWVLGAPDGSATLGPWSNATTVVPARLVDLTIPQGRLWTTGTAPSMCAGNAAASRTFSARLALTSPNTNLLTATVTVPATPADPYCWSNPIPASTAPQAAFVHVWELGNVTFLVGVLAVQLVAPGTPTGPGHTPGSGRIAPLSLGVLALAVGGAVCALVLVLAIPEARRRVLPSRLGKRPDGRPPHGAEWGDDSAGAPPPQPPPPPPPPPSLTDG